MEEAFRLAGLPWSGHTDLLAHLTGAPHVAMMFESPLLRVVLATIHIALADVPRALTQASLEATIDLAAIWSEAACAAPAPPTSCRNVTIARTLRMPTAMKALSMRRAAT